VRAWCRAEMPDQQHPRLSPCGATYPVRLAVDLPVVRDLLTSVPRFSQPPLRAQHLKYVKDFAL
jgi:hypothetical protein